MDNCVAFPVDQHLLEDVITQGKDYALTKGIIMRTREQPNSSEVISYAPHVLFPSPVPKHLFEQALAAQEDFNLLMYGVTQDQEFLETALKSAIQVDDFTRKLYEIYEKVHIKGNPAQPINFAMLRADYMFDTARGKETPAEEMKLRQIEINTIASSFAGLGSKLPELHRYNLRNIGESEKAASLPENKAVDGLAKGLVEAWKLYGNEKAAMLFFIEDVSQNIFDQRILEYTIHEVNSSVTTLRRKFSDIVERAVTKDNKLFIDNIEIAVVYFRYGYMPHQYTSEKDWEARLMMEQSLAIKCPSIRFHLVGTKKVQQELSRPGAVERFQNYFPNPAESVQRIRDTFAGLYSFDMGEDGDTTVKRALAEPEKYVMKPQREGGGNNIFGKNITATLEKIGQDEKRAEYILMDRVQPAVIPNYQIRHNTSPELMDMVSELGVFGVIIGKGPNILYNNKAGHLLRTKSICHDDGGVAAGAAVLDSPYLV
ncbi:glutathione synthetase-like [Ptychodera flava]|uniref:glutathione synthetase-like n=1 Tax=Ptychodera flava TaxID=63121 RepID=UPI003969D6F2